MANLNQSQEPQEQLEGLVDKYNLGDSGNPEDEPNLDDPNQDESQEGQLPESVDRNEYETVKSQNQQLQKRLDLLTQNMMSPEYVQFLESKRNGGQAPQAQQAPQNPQPAPEEDFDFDNASQTDLVKYIEKKLSSVVDSKVGEVNNRLNSTEYQTQVQNYKEQIKSVSEKHPDFWNYRDSMYQLSSQYPNMGAEDIYLLAKGKTVGSTPNSPQPKPASSRKPRVSGEKPGGSSPTRVKEDLNVDEALAEAMKKLDF